MKEERSYEVSINCNYYRDDSKAVYSSRNTIKITFIAISYDLPCSSPVETFEYVQSERFGILTIEKLSNRVYPLDAAIRP